jgi:hypothetical protein
VKSVPGSYGVGDGSSFMPDSKLLPDQLVTVDDDGSPMGVLDFSTVDEAATRMAFGQGRRPGIPRHRRNAPHLACKVGRLDRVGPRGQPDPIVNCGIQSDGAGI